MAVDNEQGRDIRSTRETKRKRVWAGLLGFAVLAAIALGPYGVISWVTGVIGIILLRPLLSWCAFVCWAVLVVVACRRSLQRLRTDHKRDAGLWLSVGCGIVLAYVLFWVGKAPSLDELFGRGLITHLELRTDIDAVQVWVGSLDPNDCLPVPHVNPRGRRLSKDEQPEILKRQDGMVQLELDRRGRPSVRLTWYQGKAGTFGLVIGDKTMKTPPPERGMYGEQRVELRSGIYFWYREG